MLNTQFQDVLDPTRILTPLKEIREKNGGIAYDCRVQFGALKKSGFLKNLVDHGKVRLPARLFQHSSDDRENRIGFRSFRQKSEMDTELSFRARLDLKSKYAGSDR